MFAAFCVSFTAWLMIVLASFALARDTGLVEAFAWTVGSIHAPGFFDADVYVGMRRRVVAVHGDYSTDIVTDWADDSACSAFSLAHTCEERRDALLGLARR